ncbi:MAG: hypothetical protein ACI8X5_001249 [Planctomycetota bacterium]|jgi:hypothetical protein
MRRLASLALVSLLPLMSLMPAHSEDDLETLERKLEDAPEDPNLLEACGLAALDDGEEDLGVWYLSLATDAAPDDEDLLERVAIELATFEYPVEEGAKLLGDYSETLFKVSKACAAKKLYANAVDLLLRCEGTRFEEAAEKHLEKIYGKKKALEALLASGINVPVQSSSKLSPKKIAKLDSKHADWENALEIKGKFYTIKTDMGYEMAEAMSSAMEQINTFYRKVFRYKERGGSMRSCELRVYKTREEFDSFEEDIDANVKGFYRSWENNVTTYDPRTEPRPRDISYLWSTLFHEASHQFTHAVWPNPIPTWLNEGTACYFEGTRIEPGGSVSFNGIPDSRLSNLVFLIDAGKPTVEDVITYFKPGSYDGEYYPFGWGLVYFMRNYEDEESERVYAPVFEEFMASYKSGGAHDVKARFEEYFVKKAKQKDVKTYEDFIARWEKWIKNLDAIHFGGKEMAETLIARAEKQLADKQEENAIESYKWALRKSPNDARALEGLASLLASEKESDAALYFYRKLAECARGTEPGESPEGNPEVSSEELLEGALAGIAKIDRTVAKNLGEADEKIVEATLVIAKQCAEVDLQRAALRFVQQTQKVMSGDARLTELATEYGEGLDLRRWRRINPESDLAGWRNGDDWFEKDGGVGVKAKSMSLARCLTKTAPAFRYEVQVESGKHGDVWLYGMIFGINQASGEKLFAIMPSTRKIGVVEFVKGVPDFVEEFESNVDWSADSVTIAIEVSSGKVEFFYDGELVGSMDGGEELQGRVGLFVQDAQVQFSDLRLKY